MLGLDVFNVSSHTYIPTMNKLAETAVAYRLLIIIKQLLFALIPSISLKFLLYVEITQVVH